MNREDIIRMAREAQLGTSLIHKGGEQRVWIEGADWHDELKRFAELIADEKEKQIIDILRRLQERNDSHNYYGYAINVIKGEA